MNAYHRGRLEGMRSSGGANNNNLFFFLKSYRPCPSGYRSPLACYFSLLALKSSILVEYRAASSHGLPCSPTDPGMSSQQWHSTIGTALCSPYESVDNCAVTCVRAASRRRVNRPARNPPTHLSSWINP